jgi:hypothetical protein
MRTRAPCLTSALASSAEWKGRVVETATFILGRVAWQKPFHLCHQSRMGSGIQLQSGEECEGEESDLDGVGKRFHGKRQG